MHSLCSHTLQHVKDKIFLATGQYWFLPLECHSVVSMLSCPLSYSVRCPPYVCSGAERLSAVCGIEITKDPECPISLIMLPFKSMGGKTPPINFNGSGLSPLAQNITPDTYISRHKWSCLL